MPVLGVDGDAGCGLEVEEQGSLGVVVQIVVMSWKARAFAGGRSDERSGIASSPFAEPREKSVDGARWDVTMPRGVSAAMTAGVPPGARVLRVGHGMGFQSRAAAGAAS